MKDNLGDRMKDFYESRTKIFLPRRTYTIIRIDGKAFHTYTRGLKKPFDDELINDMDETAKYLCENIQGAKFAFVQSDEISILLTDFDKIQTDAWFDGNIQKITSISASLATAKFNELRSKRTVEISGLENEEWIDFSNIKLALFDSRAFTIPSNVEVENYFIWRQQDTVRNSISSVAQSLYSHKELHNKNISELQEMCFNKGINWNDYQPKYKRGRLIVKEYFEYFETIRGRWVSVEPPIFTQKREELTALIPLFDNVES